MTTVSELVDKGDIPEERKDNVKNILHDLGYAASRAVGKAFLKITEKHMTDAGMSIADANAILAEVELLQGPSEKMIDIRQQLTRIEAATLNTFHHMFAPSISDLSQRSKLVKRICTYNANDRPAGQLWCMVLGRYLQDDMIKASHIYKRDWPAQTAAQLKLDVDTAANLFSAQKKIENAFDKFRLIIVPNNLSDYILHILDPSLGSEMINNTILNASGAAVKFADIDGAALQFVTETRPAKRAFAWHAEEALHFGKAVGWPAASLLTVPPSAWSSDTCDSSIRDQYFHDLLELQVASVSDQDEGLHD